MSLLRFFIVLIFVSLSNSFFAQVGINTDNSDPDASAILDVKSTEKGMLVPRMTSAQRNMISNAAIGLLVFDTTTETFWFNDSGGWTELVSGGTSTEIVDADGDTKIQVEESADEDLIRFDVEGDELLVIAKNSNGDTRLDIPSGSTDGLFMGKNAGRFNTADSNTGIGHLALEELTSGRANTAVGSGALADITTGFENVAFGYVALSSLTTANGNTAIGSASLQSTETGTENVGIGGGAGSFNKTGSFNVFIGQNAGFSLGSLTSNQSPDKNVLIGHDAGFNLSGDGNIFLGNEAGRNVDSDNKLYIENSDSDSPLIYGEFDNDLLRVNGTFNINNAFSFPTTDGTANQVLQTDGSGILTWEDVAGGGTQTLIEDADMDTKIQVEENADEDLIRFDVGGTQAAILQKVGNGGTQLTFSSNSHNILLGSATINSLNGANNNTIMGSNAFLNTTDGAYNTAMGAYALEQNTSGNSNNVFGSGALQLNTTGSNNIAIGNVAGWTNQTGSDNIFIGNEAGYGGGIGTGAQNVMIGKSAGEANSGSGNVFLGYQAGRNSNSSDKLFIDNSSTSSPLIYGEFDNNLLRVNGTFNINNAFSFPTTDGTANQVLQTDGSGSVIWADAAVGTQTLIEDADMDTKIQVEESADEDLIRFDVGGKERMRLEEIGFDDARLSFTNGHNLFIGRSIGQVNSVTIDNTIIGDDAFIANTTGSFNTSLGTDVLAANTTGSFNTAIGTGAMQTNTMGVSNVSLGMFSLYLNKTGNHNVAIGNNAGYSNEDGDRNVLIGYETGRNLNNKSNNVMLGFRAGLNNNGNNNLFLGTEAGKDEGGSNKLFIDNSSTSSPLIYGEFDNDLLRVNGTFNINNAFSFPTTDGTANQVLQTDGSGSLTWVDAVVGGGIQTLIEDADNDTKIQVEESADEDLIRFDIAGSEKMTIRQSTTGRPRIELLNNGNSVYIGQGAGDKDEATFPNIAIGNNTLQENIDGGYNLAIGTDNLKNNTSGISNTALGGYASLETNTTGNSNVALGSFAGNANTTGNENVLLGGLAGLGNQTGSNNVLVGHQAGAGTSGQDVHNKNNNVMVGHQAGGLNQGDGNVFLGYMAAIQETGSNKLYIENSNSSSPLIYGEFDNDLLRVNGTLNLNNAFSFPTTDGTANQILQTDGAGSVTWVDGASGGTQTLIEDADGDTKIQVEESTDEDIIRFDIEGSEIFRVLKNANGVTLFETPSSGLNSTLFGQQAGESLSTGHSNTFFGKNAGQNTASGEDNTFIGRTAGLTNTTGSGNVFVGRAAGSYSTGNNNVFLGKNAGLNNLAGDLNIFLGRNAGRDETGSNKLYIENSDINTPLVYGEFDNDLLRINGDLEVTGTFPGSDDQSIDVFNLNGNTLEISLEDDGQATQTVDLSTITSNLLTDTDGDTRIELEASPDEDKIRYFFDNPIEKFRFESNKLTLVSLSDNSPELHFQGGVTNKIVNINPLNINPTANSFRMEFYVNNQNNLTLLNDQSVRISNSYKLPTDAGTAGEALVTDGNGNSSWQNVGVPIGAVQMWPTNTPPTGWIICDGSNFNANTYPELAAILGSTTLPNFNGRMPLGVGQSDENGATNHTLNQTGGEETHVLTINEMPAHSHEILYREGSENGSGNDYSDLGDTGVTGDTTESAGGNLPHNNMPPYYTINFIIKAE